MSRLRSVVRHEYLTVVKQKGFWAYMIITPIIFLTVFLLIGFSGKTENASLEQLATDLKDVAVIDASGLVNSDIVKSSGQKSFPVSELDSLRKDVESGELKGLIYYPENIVENRQYEVYVSGVDFLFNTAVNEAGGTLLSASLYSEIGSAERIALAQQGADGVTTTYENGVASVGYTRFVIPGIIAAMFLIILMFSVGYILTSISEEKENRSMEMALTYVSPRTLIVGKLIGVVLITLTQLAFFGALAVIALLVALNTNFVEFPSNFNLAELPVDPIAIAFGISFLIVGFILFAAIMALIAVLLPAKQANNFSALFFILPIIPFWFMGSVLTDPENPVVRFITYFPITAPTTSLIRNTVGNLSIAEASLSLGIMTVFALLVLWFVVKVFPKGALEFQNPLSLRAIFSSNK